MSKSLIVITGLKQSGKDTMADYLVKEHGYIKAQPFACFKPAIADWFKFNKEQMNGKLKEVIDPRWGASPRQIMQVFGTDLMKTEMGRLLPEYKKVTGDDLWAKVFREWYLATPDGKYIVCDWRFPEERDCLEDLDNIVFVRIESNRCENIDTHASEKYVSTMETDWNIVNNGTLSDYYKTIDKFFDLALA